MSPRGRQSQPIDKRLLANMLVDEGGCWLWQGFTQGNGYGYMSGGRRGLRVGVHRAAYEAFIGPIPEGLTIDHTCHKPGVNCVGGDSCLHRRCINPDHLEAVTGTVNTLRSGGPSAINARRTHCINGHEFTPENTKPVRGGRACRECHDADVRELRKVTRMMRVPLPIYEELAKEAGRRGVSITALATSVLRAHVEGESAQSA